MKYKNIFLFFVIFLFMISCVSALNVGEKYFWNFTTLTDKWSGKVAVKTASVTSSTNFPIFSNRLYNGSTSSFDFTGNSRAINTTFVLPATNWTLNMWIAPTATTNNNILFTNSRGASTLPGFLAVFDGTNLALKGTNSGGYDFTFTSNRTVATNKWLMVTVQFSYGANNVKMWFNNTLVGQATATAIGTPTLNLILGDYLATGSAAADDYDGLMDYVQFYNKTLSAAERAYLLTYGQINPLANFTVTAISVYDGSTISSFSVTFKNKTRTWTKFTNSSTINTQIPVSNKKYTNMTFWNFSGFNRTYVNYNFSASGNLIGSLYRNYFYIFAYNKSSTKPIPLINVSITSVSTGITTKYPDAQNTTKIYCNYLNCAFGHCLYYCNITVNSNRFMKNSYNSINPNATKRINMTYAINKIYFKHSGTAIRNATIQIIYPSGYKINRTTNTSGVINFSSIPNGINETGVYTFTFMNKAGYVSPVTFTETLTSVNIPFTKNYSINVATISINIYDRKTYNLLLKNTSITFLTLFNITTSTGTFSISNVSILSNNYTIQVISTGYGIEQREITYTGTSNISLDFYLLQLNQSNAGTLFVNNYKNMVGFILMGAKDILMEYDPLTFNYKQVSECYSNSNGECGFNIELGTKTYFVRATKTINNNVYSAQTLTSGEIIITDNEIRNLVLTFNSDFTVLPEDDIVYSIIESFVSNTSTITVNFYSISGLPKEMCVQYFSTIYGSSTSEYKNCLNSSSALQTIPAIKLLNRSKSYRAEVYLVGSLGNTYLQTFNYPSINDSISETFDIWIINGFVLFIFVCLLALSLYMKNITLFSVTAIIFSWIQVLILPNYSLVSVATFITIISILLIITQKKPNEE